MAASRYAQSARLCASLLGRDFILANALLSAVEEAAGVGADSLLLFGAPADFTEPVVAELWRREREGLLFGLVPSRSLREACEWIAKRFFHDLLFESHTGTLMLVRDESAGSLEGEAGVIAESAFGQPEAEQAQSAHELLVSELHAKECCARFNDFVFCGAPEVRTEAGTYWAPTRTLPVATPGCGEGRGCVWPMPRLPVRSLVASHVVAVSCGSVRLDNNLFDADFGLGLNTFHGPARSLIGPVRFVVCTPLTPAYLADIARSGARLGDVNRLANSLQLDSSTDSPSFVLLGDPEDRVSVLRADDPVWTTASSVEGRVGAPAPPPPGAPGSPSAVRARPSEPIEQPSAEPVPEEILAFAGLATGGSLEGLLERLAYADNRQGCWLTLKYGQAGSKHQVLPGMRPCLWCSTPSTVYRRTAATREWVREAVNCPRCGVVSDSPAGVYGDYDIAIPETVACGETMVVRARGARRLVGDNWAGILSLIHCTAFGWESFETESVSLLDLPEERVLRMAPRVPSSVYPFSFWLRAVWLSREGLVWLSRPLRITA
ncbi:MAG: hypothetical protein R3F14_34265 [Polyangiaceae bacterium]